ncbi:MAG TPA: UDP-N-acetylglucosamine 2-epimerase (non-hydrolyzing) [Gemmatimonadaceae bacterium]|nr:UDP-N-acetylglucosamine 2-epimerase (non-hydrolyzing) [Gemmatimonadaceae bacterium]
MKLVHVVGARPNFPKLAPVFRAGCAATRVEQLVVHTGQHYDDALSGSFFRDLGIPEPDINLEVGSATHAVQTARIMERIEPLLHSERPDWVVVYGDVNSTAAAALVASKLGIRIAHVEAGLRSGDRTMPEEINRIVTDRLADLLLTPSEDANAVLRSEGEPDDEIVFVGNVMVDSLLHALDRACNSGARERLRADGRHVVVTLHRPSNVDVETRLRTLSESLSQIAAERTVLFPAHPRTRAKLRTAQIRLDGIQLIEPLSYLEMIDVVVGAHAVVTDSGGLQEETTALGVPCFTVRDTTERPITITEGTNQLVQDLRQLPGLVEGAARPSAPRRPRGWDGRAGRRVIEALATRSSQGR